MKKRNDDILEKKWSQPRALRSELDPYNDPGLDCSNDPGLTDQSQSQEADINFLLKRYQKTGVLPGINKEALYGDFSSAQSYHDAINIITQAEQQFEALDAQTRKRFLNDPAEFLNFATDPANGEELVKLGLAVEIPSDPLLDAVKALKPEPTPSPAVPK